ncbi:hypothetical protein ABH926_009939 [Catenulispora sp. GP43]|uniref:hypothetical protein n=1 Tax=Catenulispora sp. GP43 TaxID=3156263 RepID=UPI0035193EFD
MNRPTRRALTAIAAISSLAFTGLSTSACAAKHTVPKAHVITIPAPDQVSDVFRAGNCPWLQMLQNSEAQVYNMLISSPLCADKHSMAGN